jgi:hypothetical protein
MKSKDISIEKKAKIMCWAAEKIPTKEIAADLGIHPATVWRHLAILRELPPTASPQRTSKDLVSQGLPYLGRRPGSGTTF